MAEPLMIVLNSLARKQDDSKDTAKSHSPVLRLAVGVAANVGISRVRYLGVLHGHLLHRVPSVRVFLSRQFLRKRPSKTSRSLFLCLSLFSRSILPSEFLLRTHTRTRVKLPARGVSYLSSVRFDRDWRSDLMKCLRFLARHNDGDDETCCSTLPARNKP